MHSIKLLLPVITATLATVASALRVPEGTPDGFYRAYVQDGVEFHEPVLPSDLAQRSASASDGASFNETATDLQKRIDSDWDTWCGCGFTLDPASTDAAVDDLKYQVRDRPFIQHGYSYYSIRGNTVAFVCASGLTLSQSPEGVTNAYSMITKRCGRYIAGTANFANENYAGHLIGYMRVVGDFCRDATGSPVNHC